MKPPRGKPRGIFQGILSNLPQQAAGNSTLKEIKETLLILHREIMGEAFRTHILGIGDFLSEFIWGHLIWQTLKRYSAFKNS
jgi:hypothetical protein